MRGFLPSPFDAGPASSLISLSFRLACFVEAGQEMLLTTRLPRFAQRWQTFKRLAVIRPRDKTIFNERPFHGFETRENMEDG
jgi:hypothetical protein